MRVIGWTTALLIATLGDIASLAWADQAFAGIPWRWLGGVIAGAGIATAFAIVFWPRREQ